MQGLFRFLLIPFSWIYGAVIALRNYGFDTGIFRVRRVEAPVISVGNITVGGTGKTPLVEFIVGHYLSRGVQPAVVSRGYRRTSSGTVVVSDGVSVLVDAAVAGDEPYQIARKFRKAIVVVDEKRFRGANVAVERNGAEVVILDDGFQHRWLHRDCDLVIVNGDEPEAERSLLPAGRRRESESSLKRANAVLYTGRIVGEKDHPSRPHLWPESVRSFGISFHVETYIEALNGERHPATMLDGKKCVAFCGIGNPERFRQTLQGLGVRIAEFISFPDHHKFREAELKRIGEHARIRQADCLITTEKDLARIGQQGLQFIGSDLPFYAAVLTVRFGDEQQFKEFLDHEVKIVTNNASRNQRHTETKF